MLQLKTSYVDTSIKVLGYLFAFGLIKEAKSWRVETPWKKKPPEPKPKPKYKPLSAGILTITATKAINQYTLLRTRLS